jgi:hypothetical protein
VDWKIGGASVPTSRIENDSREQISLPEFAVGAAYASFERGEFPEGLSAEQMMKAV